MSQLPRAFRRDAARIADLTETDPVQGAQGTLHMKHVAHEFRKIVTRWQHDPVCLAEGKAIHLFQSQLRSLESNLEKFYLSSLCNLLRNWRERFIQETLLRGQIAMHQLIQQMPTEELTVGIKNVYTDGKADTYDPEADYRDCEKDADVAAEAYRAEWAEFKASWPERIDPAFLARLENLTIEGYNAWVAEISPK